MMKRFYIILKDYPEPIELEAKSFGDAEEIIGRTVFPRKEIKLMQVI